MRITRVDIRDNISGNLNPIKMEKIGQVVLIAGKNGSGKSRLLKNISEALSRKPLDAEALIIRRQENIDALNYNIQSLITVENPPDKKRIHANIENYETDNKSINFQLLCDDSLHLTGDIRLRHVIDFVPSAIQLHDPMNLAHNAIVEYSDSAENNLGVSHLPHAALAKIQHIQNRWREATHQDSAHTIENMKAIKDYERLNDSIHAFLGVRLGRTTNAVATLFNQEIGKASLSKGQIVLLQLCIELYAQGTKLSDSIIMMDEPENHLHPEALIELVNKIQSVLTNGQLWIATHSIHLLAHCPPSSIWYMQNGSVNYSEKIPEQVLTGLMGGKNEIIKLADFLNLPAQMASVQFAFECLLPPEAIQTGPDDPQTGQIIDAIKSIAASNRKIKVLDFGAGQGRLLSAIKDLDDSFDLPISDWLDYFAYDLPESYEKECRSVITEVYGNSEERYFSDKQKLLENVKLNSFDIIIMCNVFHEIDPMNWLSEFNEHAICRSCLKDDGHLLIVEDQLIPVGEKAYENGFLVFDQLQFKKLFLIDTYKTLSRKNDRLKAHFIPASKLVNINEATRKDSISNFKNLAFDKIKELRKREGNTSNGRLHAFWSQQAVNSTLVLEQLG